MRGGLKRAALLGAVGLLAAPAVARATLVYQTGVAKQSVWVAADDGSGARKLTVGASPRVSPDGQTVAFVTGVSGASPVLREMPAAGGPARTLVRSWRFGIFAWSSDGRYIATQTGPLNGRQRLVLIDRTTGAVRIVARGFFAGASFSPAGDQLVYSRFPSERRLFPKADLYIAPVAGGPAHRLTSDGHSLYPLWGPRQIAFVRWQRPTGRHRREDGPKYNLWLIRPDGSGRRQLTRDRVPFLLTGLVPTDWSADGKRLLAQFGGQDTTYPVTVDPATGRERVVGSKSRLMVATALSKDGSTILGFTGADILDPRHENLITTPYLGGRLHTLKRGASDPDWNR